MHTITLAHLRKLLAMLLSKQFVRTLAWDMVIASHAEASLVARHAIAGRANRCPPTRWQPEAQSHNIQGTFIDIDRTYRSAHGQASLALSVHMKPCGNSHIVAQVCANKQNDNQHLIQTT